jgi:3-isopropylmalate/(R)-2-methylmalate dehydratase large subunit
MKRTLASQIIASHTTDPVKEGAICRVSVDFAFVNDITAPPAIDAMAAMGRSRVFDRKRCAIIPDHFTPNKDIASAEQAKKSRIFASEQKMLYWEVGRAGIEHAMLPEKGHILPGDIVLGADSHTCTGGAMGAFSTGMGSTDLAGAWATGETWLMVPPTVRIDFRGSISRHITGKDLILAVLREISVQGARYMALEFGGDALASMSMDHRFTVANMAVEAGGKAGLFVPDETTLAYAEARASRPFTARYPDEGCEYAKRVEIDVDKLTPLVAAPHSPDNVRPASTFGDTEIQQVFIGSCTNGRLEDMAAAASVLEGKKVHPSVRCIVIPASYEVYNACLEKGYIRTFTEAGAAVCTPTCGPCLGGHMGILAEGERCVSTSNRNFVGRMGHPKSEVYLASPVTAAWSAVKGHIADPAQEEA